MPRRFGRNDGSLILASELAGDAELYGTLESELDDSVTLHGAFAELHARYTSLRNSYHTGKIDGNEFGAAMSELRVRTSDGDLWTIGTTTGRWYRRGLTGGAAWSTHAAPTDQAGELVNRSGVVVGWSTETYDPDQHKQLSLTAYTGDVAVDEHPEVPAQTRSGDDTDVAEMFGSYLESVSDSTEGEYGVLEVDDLGNPDDDWKQHYLADSQT